MNKTFFAKEDNYIIIIESIKKFKKYENTLKARKILPPEANNIVFEFIGAHAKLVSLYTDEFSIDDHLWCREQIEKAMKDTDPAGKRL